MDGIEGKGRGDRTPCGRQSVRVVGLQGDGAALHFLRMG